MAHFEKTISSEKIFDGSVIRVSKDTVSLENGATAYREIVRHNGGAGVIALDAQNNIYLVRQYRYALGKELIEIPAGKLEKGEEPLLAAKRELTEETGVIAQEYKQLGKIVPTCGYCDEIIYIYAAKNLQQTQQNTDEDEFVSVFTVHIDEAVQMVMQGEIEDSKTVAAILKLKILLQSGEF